MNDRQANPASGRPAHEERRTRQRVQLGVEVSLTSESQFYTEIVVEICVVGDCGPLSRD